MDNNLDRAHKIVNMIVEVDYHGNQSDFERECGTDLAEKIYFWLEDGNGDGLTVDECRLAFEL